MYVHRLCFSECIFFLKVMVTWIILYVAVSTGDVHVPDCVLSVLLSIIKLSNM